MTPVTHRVRQGLFVATVILYAVSVNFAQETPADARFEQWFEQVSNEGRWGADDEMGTLNFITAETTRAAVATVRAGVSVSLSRPLEPGEDVNAIAPLEVDYTGDASGDRASFFGDRIGMVYHGWTYSHVDALAHLASNGAMYNGHAESLAGRKDGPSKLGIENMQSGIVTRGVLIDGPWLMNVPFLEPGVAITLEDIEEWEKRTGVTIRRGDVVLIRTGRGAREARQGTWNVREEGAPGPHPEIATLLHERGAAVLGGDVVNEIYPSVIPGNDSVMHLLAIVSMGMPLLDNLGLEAVSREAQARNQWTFLFVAAPLPIRHATGSALNPLAIF